METDSVWSFEEGFSFLFFLRERDIWLIRSSLSAPFVKTLMYKLEFSDNVCRCFKMKLVLGWHFFEVPSCRKSVHWSNDDDDDDDYPCIMRRKTPCTAYSWRRFQMTVATSNPPTWVKARSLGLNIMITLFKRNIIPMNNSVQQNTERSTSSSRSGFALRLWIWKYQHDFFWFKKKKKKSIKMYSSLRSSRTLTKKTPLFLKTDKKCLTWNYSSLSSYDSATYSMCSPLWQKGDKVSVWSTESATKDLSFDISFTTTHTAKLEVMVS